MTDPVLLLDRDLGQRPAMDLEHGVVAEAPFATRLLRDASFEDTLHHDHRAAGIGQGNDRTEPRGPILDAGQLLEQPGNVVRVAGVLTGVASRPSPPSKAMPC